MSVREHDAPVPTVVSPNLRKLPAVPDHPSLSDLPPLPGRLLRVARPATMALFQRRWQLHVHHADRVPKAGGVILASNHIAVLDGPLLVGASPRRTHALGKVELFRGFVGTLLRAAGQIPVERGAADLDAVRRCVQVLQAGHGLAIFPEGVRGRGDFSVTRPGAAYLAMLTGAPIVPVAILGTRLPDQNTKQRPPAGSTMHVVFGDPIEVARRSWPRRRDQVAAEGEVVREKLAAHVQYATRLTGMPLPGNDG